MTTLTEQANTLQTKTNSHKTNEPIPDDIYIEYFKLHDAINESFSQDSKQANEILSKLKKTRLGSDDDLWAKKEELGLLGELTLRMEKLRKKMFGKEANAISKKTFLEFLKLSDEIMHTYGDEKKCKDAEEATEVRAKIEGMVSRPEILKREAEWKKKPLTIQAEALQEVVADYENAVSIPDEAFNHYFELNHTIASKDVAGSKEVEKDISATQELLAKIKPFLGSDEALSARQQNWQPQSSPAPKSKLVSLQKQRKAIAETVEQKRKNLTKMRDERKDAQEALQEIKSKLSKPGLTEDELLGEESQEQRDESSQEAEERKKRQQETEKKESHREALEKELRVKLGKQKESIEPTTGDQLYVPLIKRLLTLINDQIKTLEGKSDQTSLDELKKLKQEKNELQQDDLQSEFNRLRREAIQRDAGDIGSLWEGKIHAAEKDLVEATEGLLNLMRKEVIETKNQMQSMLPQEQIPLKDQLKQLEAALEKEEQLHRAEQKTQRTDREKQVNELAAQQKTISEQLVATEQTLTHMHNQQAESKLAKLQAKLEQIDRESFYREKQPRELILARKKQVQERLQEEIGELATELENIEERLLKGNLENKIEEANKQLPVLYKKLMSTWKDQLDLISKIEKTKFPLLSQ